MLYLKPGVDQRRVSGVAGHTGQISRGIVPLVRWLETLFYAGRQTGRQFLVKVYCPRVYIIVIER